MFGKFKPKPYSFQRLLGQKPAPSNETFALFPNRCFIRGIRNSPGLLAGSPFCVQMRGAWRRSSVLADALRAFAAQ